MAYFAVDISLAQLGVINTQVVVEANHRDDAQEEALRVLFETIGTSPGPLHIQEENLSISNMYQVTPDEDTNEAERIPYVYDLDTHTEYAGPLSAGDILGIKPDLDGDDFDLLAYLRAAGPQEELPVVKFTPTQNRLTAWLAAEETGPRTTSDGTPVLATDTFENRPTADLKRPICTTESGYTPIDGEFRHHAPRPFFLGGNACIKIGEQNSCSGAGTGRGQTTSHSSYDLEDEDDDYENDSWDNYYYENEW